MRKVRGSEESTGRWETEMEVEGKKPGCSLYTAVIDPRK